MGLEVFKKSSSKKNKAKGKAVASLEAHLEVAANFGGSGVFFSARPLKKGEVLLQEEGEVLQQLERLVLGHEDKKEEGQQKDGEKEKEEEEAIALNSFAMKKKWVAAQRERNARELLIKEAQEQKQQPTRVEGRR